MTTAGPGDEPLLVARNLRVAYDGPDGRVEAVRGIDLDLAPGEAVGLVGASGSGKSSVCAAVLGLAGPGAQVTADELRFAGRDLLAARRGRHRAAGTPGIAYVPQQPGAALVPTVAVGRQLAWYLGADVLERHRDELVGLGLDAVLDRPHDLPGAFSGGQLQRVVLAVAALGEAPRLLLADEPTSTLDTTTQATVLDLIDDLRARLGLAVLHVSHDLGVVASRCDRVGVLDAGRLVEVAPVADLFTAPTHPATRRLLAAAPPPTTAAPPPTTSNSVRNEDAEVAFRTKFEQVGVGGGEGAAVLEVDRLFHYYGRGGGGPASATVVRAVDDLSFDLAEGRVLAVVGGSGSGKTTLARAVAGAIVPTAGELRLDGRPLGRVRTEADRRAIQLVGQHPWDAFNPRRTVGHALVQALRVHGIGATNGERQERAVAALVRTGLRPVHADRRPAQLSGGELARVALARALVVEPRLVLLDEPTASLDAPVARQVLDLVAQLRADLGLTVLLVTHDLPAARTLADEVAVLDAGLLVEHGPADVVLTTPTSPAARALLAAEPRRPT